MNALLYTGNNVIYHFILYYITCVQKKQEKKKKLPVEKDLASFLRSLSYIKYNTLLGYLNEKVVKSEGEESPEKILHDLLFITEKRGKSMVSGKK